MNKIINLYKPAGPTSFDMVRSVRRLLKVKKAGHIGTLDPLAEGVLPICLGQSTRVIQFLTPLTKVYRATMTLGVSTDTQDRQGKVLERRDPAGVTKEDVESLLARLVGPQKQVPPMYSAKKKNGIPLYKLARNGITIDRKPVDIRIHATEFIEKIDEKVHFRVHCSAGTYVRTLCHDIGETLGCGAHMSHLIREKVGEFDLESSLSLEELELAKEQGNLSTKLLQAEQALDFLPEIQVHPDRVQSIAHGRALTKAWVQHSPNRFGPGMNFRVTNEDNRLVAIVEPLVDQDRFINLEPDEIAFKLKRVLI
ncbi:tRNA pseudouridine synthase B [Nitrospina gracilis 3/211]|uniref:tRNA pseudouridine synthase B n=1 Tax=Nitrospina gracilis (strain 3/211) TaxID=1266370 RepID=M1YNI3_NITG3|nr:MULTISPECIES: tRNA pseudouridine(55) synthase TruB [Nitrospina]MCF8724800.1 tRNA pseudouridine55 synthase [Nitrospina sp. Nb-3]CCQ92075.1 tRNA pseudouridine synthase B [Nitrospina gracilis 3/211]